MKEKQKLLEGFLHFLNSYKIWVYIWLSLCVECLVKKIQITVFFSGSFHQVLRITKEDSIYETALWTIFILINISTALKGPHFLISYALTILAKVFGLCANRDVGLQERKILSVP